MTNYSITYYIIYIYIYRNKNEFCDVWCIPKINFEAESELFLASVRQPLSNGQWQFHWIIFQSNKWESDTCDRVNRICQDRKRWIWADPLTGKKARPMFSFCLWRIKSWIKWSFWAGCLIERDIKQKIKKLGSKIQKIRVLKEAKAQWRQVFQTTVQQKRLP